MQHLRLLLSTLVVAVTLAGCPEPTPTDDGPPADECTTSTDCREAGTELGSLCSDGDCTPCETAADCAADAVYGDDATCIEGRCTVCEPGEVGCACLDDQYCLQGEGCRDGLCRPCDPGDALCGCAADGDCGDGFACVDQRCVERDCAPGVEGCVCDGDDDCADGLTCGDGVCRACPSDVAGCPCADDGSCSNDLVCDNDSVACRPATDCTELVCGTARLCSVSGQVARCLDECATGFTFDPATETCSATPGANCDAGRESSILTQCETQNRVCVESGETAACGACSSTADDCFVGPSDPAAGACRAPTTCDSCADASRTCTPAPVCGDVTCGDCIAGTFEYAGSCDEIVNVECDVCEGVNRECLLNDGGPFCGRCEPNWSEDATGDCVAVENCQANAENSILDRCISLGRECIEASGGAPASCGECPEDSEEDPVTSNCITPGACFSRDDCNEADGLFCTQRTLLDTPVCRRSECAAGEALDRGTQACVQCALSCPTDAANGTLGVWPVTDRNGDCLCATAPGFFWDDAAAGGAAVECDKDEDGWINDKIFDLFRTSKRSEGASFDDWSMILSANCTIPVINTVELQNEWNQTLILDVIADLDARGSVILYETARNDRDDEALLSVDPDVVNSLTKNCGVALDDYNDNAVSDFVENQTSTGTPRPWQPFFNKLTYFRELYTSVYDDSCTGDGATRVCKQALVIKERRRDGGCAGSSDSCTAENPPTPFAFHYFDVDDDAAAHWQCCTRRRDAGYNAARQTGYDFASRDCSRTTGTCQYTWPEEWARTGTFATPPPAAPGVPVGGIGAYDACDERPAEVIRASDPAASTWRGMTHYSQFKCAKVVNVPATADPAEVRVADLFTGVAAPTAISYIDSAAPWQLQSCTTSRNGTTTCAPVSTTSGITDSVNKVAWVARRFNDYSNLGPAGYTGGCIDEWIETPEMCPGFVDNPVEGAVLGDGDSLDFGELSCGCGEGYGGTDCERGCPTASIHVQAPYTPANRVGFWTCTEPAVSGFGGTGAPTFDGVVDTDIWSIDAKVPLGGSVGAPMSAGEFSLR